MAHIVEDRIKETTTTTGTGTITLAGAAAGFRAFSAVCANTDTVHYTIDGGAEWEVGLGTWGTGNVLARTTILNSSNAGAAVNFSAGTKNVFLTRPAADWGPPREVTGASYSFLRTDLNGSVVANSGSAQTFTIEPDSTTDLPIGSKIKVFRKGAGLPKIVAGAGVTLHLPTGMKPKRFMGASLKKTTNQTAANYSAGAVVTFDGEIYDTDGFHDTGSNTERITIPSGMGIKRVSFNAGLQFQSVTANQTIYMLVRKDGSGSFDGYNETSVVSVGTTRGMSMAVLGVDCVAGNYFDVYMGIITDTSVDVLAAQSSFKMMVEEVDAQGYIIVPKGTVEIEKIGANEWIFSDQSALG